MRPSAEVKGKTNVLRGRLAHLASDSKSELRRLQYDTVSELVKAQRTIVQLHSEAIAMLRADRKLYRQQRLESLELALACDGLHELIREIERALNSTAN